MPLRTPLLLLLVVTVLLTACSRVGLAYRNLDWLIPWKLDDYLPLNAEQSAWLKPRLQQHLAWHCSVELPRYLEWLAGNQALLDQPDEAQLNAQLDAFADAVQRLAVQLTPTATDLLRSLSPYQVEQLFAALEQQNAKLHEEYVAPSREQQIARRAQRMEERLQPWFGSLKQDQRDSVVAWANRLDAQNPIWMDNRLAWQQALRDALEVRRGDDFAPRLSALLQQRERFYTEAYRASYANNRQALAELFHALLTQTDAEQRERARQRLASLRRDLAAEQCTPDGAQASS